MIPGLIVARAVRIYNDKDGEVYKHREDELAGSVLVACIAKTSFLDSSVRPNLRYLVGLGRRNNDLIAQAGLYQRLYENWLAAKELGVEDEFFAEAKLESRRYEFLQIERDWKATWRALQRKMPNVDGLGLAPEFCLSCSYIYFGLDLPYSYIWDEAEGELSLGAIGELKLASTSLSRHFWSKSRKFFGRKISHVNRRGGYEEKMLYCYADQSRSYGYSHQEPFHDFFSYMSLDFDDFCWKYEGELGGDGWELRHVSEQIKRENSIWVETERANCWASVFQLSPEEFAREKFERLDKVLPYRFEEPLALLNRLVGCNLYTKWRYDIDMPSEENLEEVRVAFLQAADILLDLMLSASGEHKFEAYKEFQIIGTAFGFEPLKTHIEFLMENVETNKEMSLCESFQMALAMEGVIIDWEPNYHNYRGFDSTFN